MIIPVSFTENTHNMARARSATAAPAVHARGAPMPGPMLARGAPMPGPVLAHHLHRAQLAQNLSQLLETLTNAAEGYQGADLIGMGHSGQVAEEVADFQRLLRSRPTWSKICECGFNAGHSAALWLHETSAHLISFDYGTLPYSHGSRDLLSALYPHRTTFHLGDSVVTMARFAQRVSQGLEAPCDLWFLDGTHTNYFIKHDLTNALASLQPDGWIIGDDCSRRFAWVGRQFRHLAGISRVVNFSQRLVNLRGALGLRGWCIGRNNASWVGSNVTLLLNAPWETARYRA